MRPEIQDRLAERITAIYRDAGYTTKSEFVNDAVRRRLETLERGTHHRTDTVPDFGSRTSPQSTGAPYGVNPFTPERDDIRIDTYTYRHPNELVLADTRHPRQLTARLLRLTDITDSGDRRLHPPAHAPSGDDLNLVFIDTDREYVPVQKFLDGNRVILGGNVGLNPLAITATPPDVLAAADGDLDPYTTKLKDVMAFFETLFAARGDDLGDRRGVLERAVKKAYANSGISRNPDTHANDSPTITDVVAVLEEMVDNPGEYAYTATDEAPIRDHASSLLLTLQPCMDGGSLDNLARDTEVTIDAAVTYFDLQTTSDVPTAVLLQALITSVYEQAKQNTGKTVIVIDSLRHLLETAPDIGFFAPHLDHDRYYGVSTHLVVEDTAAFLQTPGATDIIDRAAITHLHPETPRTIADRVGVPRSELEFAFTNMPEETGTFVTTPMTAMPVSTELEPHEELVAEYDPHADDRTTIREAQDIVFDVTNGT